MRSLCSGFLHEMNRELGKGIGGMHVMHDVKLTFLRSQTNSSGITSSAAAVQHMQTRRIPSWEDYTLKRRDVDM